MTIDEYNNIRDIAIAAGTEEVILFTQLYQLILAENLAKDHFNKYLESIHEQELRCVTYLKKCIKQKRSENGVIKANGMKVNMRAEEVQ